MLFVILVLITSSAFAQNISLGVTGGLPLNHTLDGSVPIPTGIFGQCGECASARTLPYVVGPRLELHLGGQFRLSFEALYNRTAYDHTSTTFFTPVYASFTDEKHTVDRWEFPVLLKYSLKPWHHMFPFVALGGSIQYDQDTTVSRLEGYVKPPLSAVIPGFNLNLGVPAASHGPGAVIAAGASFGSGRFHPTLEYRFTRWANHAIEANPLVSGGVSQTAGPPTLRASQNESQLLAGFVVDFQGTSPVSRADQSSNGSAGHRFTAGVMGGLPLTAAFSAVTTSGGTNVFGKCGECGTERTVPYIAGPSMEIRLAGAYSIAVEALYSRADYNYTLSSISVSSSSFVIDYKHGVDRWELPVLLKYSFYARNPFRPFFGLGGSVQYGRDSTVQALTGTFGFFARVPSVAFLTTPQPTNTAVVAGPTVAVGTRVGGSRLSPSIEFRYSRWFDQAFTQPNPLYFAAPTVHSSQNQAQLLVGIRF